MKNRKKTKIQSCCKFLALIIFILAVSISHAQQSVPEGQVYTDTIINKKEKRKKERAELKQSNLRHFIFLGSVYAWLKTQVSFELLDGLLSANIGLEENLGFIDKRIFYTGAYVYRATPRSGLYVQYYGINRSRIWTNKNEFIFLRDTIPSGLKTTAYFNTQVVSAGYLLSLLKAPEAFLGAYFNVFVIFLRTGVRSDIGNIDLGFKLDAPLPNFGLIAIFRLTRWLYFDANFGYFSLNAKYFGGAIFDLDVGLTVAVTKWLGLSVAYQEFDVNIYFPNKIVNTVVDYNFRGPSFVLRANF